MYWWAGLDSNQRNPKMTDLQSARFNRLHTDPLWRWGIPRSRPSACKAVALPSELHPRIGCEFGSLTHTSASRYAVLFHPPSFFMEVATPTRWFCAFPRKTQIWTALTLSYLAVECGGIEPRRGYRIANAVRPMATPQLT